MRTISETGPGAHPTVRADARRLHHMLTEVARRRSLRDPISATCARLDLSAPQIHLLLSLVHDGPLPMGDLARRVAVTEKTITGLVDRLERDGLVGRTRTSADRRVVRVKLTPRGSRLARKLDQGMLDRLAWLLGELGPGLRRDLFRIMDKLVHLLQEKTT
jgi:DNA-binding MarR family transcriptional regulator